MSRSGSPRGRIKWFRSVRARLLAIALLPMLVVMPLFLGVIGANWANRFDNLLIAKVNSDLTIAHQYLQGILERSGERVQALGQSAEFARVMTGENDAEIVAYLDVERKALGLDFLYFVTRGGQVFSAPALAGNVNVMKWPVVQQAVAGQDATEIDIFQADDLAAFSPDLAQQALIKLVPTEAAVPTDRQAETRGMVVHTATALKGDIPAALVGGLLLNRNLPFIDTINDLVYPAASLTEGSRGTATLFLDDVRISTNVRLFENVRALGTRVSAIVRSTVLDGGKVWLDRAFVVNDWYISAYEPIVDSFGKRVGMLYVGFLDTPFQAAKQQTLKMVLGGFLMLVLLSVPIFLRWANGIIKPLERMVATITRVEGGDMGARTGLPAGQQDEVGRVAGHLDNLLDQLQERDRKLRDWAEELNRRVAERTRELSDANQRLEATTKQLLVAEKLAAIGEITAGIAHEINNPIAVIQGNLDVIRQEVGNDTGLDTEFGLIYEQVHSVNVLVSKLLQFARPEEYAGFVEHHVPDDVINDSIPLVQHLLGKGDIKLVLDLHADHPVAMNRTELQQVLINLIVNAIHAMPKGGTLTLRSVNKDEGDVQGIEIEVSDTGTGMPPKVLECVFDPFFTTKQAEGTGLGLSISQKLVLRSGGQIRARSQQGHGTAFTVWVPAAQFD